MSLEVRGLEVGGRPPFSFSVASGEIVAILGRNGSGKSTLLGTLAGEFSASRGEVLVDGVAVSGQPVHRRVAAGVAFISENRDVFDALTVIEHLRLFRAERDARRAVFDVFPRLAELGGQRASTLSGGEQQMLALARGVVGSPRVLLVDEPSAGLSPKIGDDLYRCIRGIAARGAAVVIAEQNTDRARSVAHGLVVLGEGDEATRVF